MRATILFAIVLLFSAPDFLIAQNNKAAIEIKGENFTAYNREVSYGDGTVYLDAKPDDGLLWLNNANFKNGTIELDIKGKDVRGRSFVGVAFHGKDNEAFDCVYFRPFNFRNPDRKSHSVQYISSPKHDWSKLRKEFPGKYESEIDPAPNPNEWLHAKIVVAFPLIKVYVNGSKEPHLEVKQISDREEGKLGFWVGNGSDGWFRHLKITNR